MSESTLQGYALPAPENTLTGRRIFFTLVVLVSMVALTWLLAFALSVGGFGVIDCILVVLFAVTLPWSVIGFWNATFGLFIMRAADPVAAVTPVSARVKGDEPITARTAILWCVRNEDAARVSRNIEPMMEGIVAAGCGAQFHVFILSDTNLADHAADEEARYAALAARWEGRLHVTYRRRTENTGFKAGNIFDFCTRWGGDYDFAVTLDADSFQTAGSILRMVRIMQIDPKLGILQSLVVGMPSTSAFARIFQFGMRLGMRSYTLGSAWWQGDCGPYWGHNAILRLAPFIAHCHLPPRPDGTHILSHDQIEAVLMRRAGYEVRVLPEEGASWEENPTTLLEFIRRDLRWAQGNMQYWPFLVMPGLKPVSRYQIGFAMLMFLGSPAWIGLLVLGTLAVATLGAADFIRPDAGMALFVITLIMWFAPKIATVLDVISRPKLRTAFGGAGRFVLSTITETIFFLMLSPIMWFGHTMFLAGLLLGKRIGWGGQARDDHSVAWGDAAKVLWPHTLLGSACILVLAFTVPAAIPYALFIAAGPALSIPLAVITSWPAVGRLLMRTGIGALPEEHAAPAELRQRGVPAIEAAAQRAA
ncbi:MAG TPA: glucans biosynthesis glucosyltransferase MdoH [Xanthobacteraceae bacterium]|nr:glucans biosynthesis glucosyltransferase MdoH [Xanthobacteraceae bacterium]